MFLTDIAVVLAVVIFIAAVAIEVRRDRGKKMYVGGEAKTQMNEQLPVATQEELKNESKPVGEQKKTA